LQDCPTPSLSHSLPSLPPIGDEQPPRRTPMTPPASHPSSCTPPSLFSRRRRPCARLWRPKLRWQDSRCCLAINALWTPPTPPNRWPPLRPAVDPAAALASRVEHARGLRERATRSRACAHPFLLHFAPFCTASNAHSRDILA
jgi:hypothetical protein